MVSPLLTHLDQLPITQLPTLLAKCRLLPQIRRELLIDQAIAGISCAPEETELAQQKFYQANQIVELPHRQAWLQHYGMTLEQLEELAVRELKLEKFKQEKWGNQLESIFLTHKAKLDKVVYSILRVTKLEVAQELFFRIQNGEQTFAEVAKEYSEGVETQTGGLIGPVELSQIHPVLAQKLLTSQPGQLCPPIKLDQWFVIARLEQRINAQLDELTQRKLLDSLFEAWLQEALKPSAPVSSDLVTA